MADAKPHLNVVFVGHVDAGKSTSVGRLLLDTDHIKPHVIEKFRKEAEERGKGGFEFAYVMDGLKEERERGVTIDVAHKEFFTKKYYYTIIDAPGHRDFVKNMITGASQADVAVLVVAAPEGVMAQTEEHAFLCKVLGVEKLIVAVNKMDASKYSEDRFKEVQKDVKDLLKKAMYKTKNIPFIPISAFEGDNMANKSENMPWYTGPTLFELLDGVEMPDKPTDKPLRLPVQDVYKISGIGTVPVGRIETGVLLKGKEIVFQPANVDGLCKSIEMHHQQMERAEPGDNVGFNTSKVSLKDIRRGDVVGYPDNPPNVVSHKASFVAQIMVLKHPKAITIGYTPVFHCHTAQIACRFVELMNTIDPATGQAKETNPDFLKTGDAAMVRIQPTKPMVIEEQAKFRELSRFAIRDMGTTVAAGLCVKVMPAEKPAE